MNIMAILRNGQLSGLIGPVVGAVVNKVQTLRSAPRKRSKNSWSASQNQSRQRFRAMAELWNRFRFTEVQQIWKLADRGKRGINLFISVNSGAFGPGGELTDPPRLHFSAGRLPLPHHLSAERSIIDPSKVEVTWENTAKPNPARGDDELLLMVWDNGLYKGPVHTGVWRKAGSAEPCRSGLPSWLTR